MSPSRRRRALSVALAGGAAFAAAATRRRKAGGPTLRDDRHGDAGLADVIGRRVRHGDRLAAAVVDLSEDEPIRWAGRGADRDTPFEIGSVTKALNGVVFSHLAERGVIHRQTRAGANLPLSGPIAETPLEALLTHRSGLPRLGGGCRHILRGLKDLRAGRNPYSESRDDVMRQASQAKLSRGRHRYSNLGAAVAGHAMAAAAGTSYERLIEVELGDRYGLRATEVATTTSPPIPVGYWKNGRPAERWVLGGYAPAGGIVSTIGDMAVLVEGILREHPDALDRQASFGRMGIGWYWLVLRRGDRHLVLHNGMTGGYRSMVVLDPRRGRGAVVLSNHTKTRVDGIAFRLLGPAKP